MSYVAALLLVLALIIGWTSNLIGMPGNWLMVVATALHAYFGPLESRLAIGWKVVAALAVLAVAGELVELLAGALGAAKVGGSRRAALLALAGSVLGGMLGMFAGLSVPVLGPIIAGVLLASVGALLGAAFGELSAGRSLPQSWQVGKGAFWGRLLGTLGKTIVASAMVAVAVAALVF